jgi:hypothetical protein
MHSLVTVEAVKEEPVWPRNITDRWHINYPNELLMECMGAVHLLFCKANELHNLRGQPAMPKT